MVSLESSGFINTSRTEEQRNVYSFLFYKYNVLCCNILNLKKSAAKGEARCHACYLQTEYDKL